MGPLRPFRALEAVGSPRGPAVASARKQGSGWVGRPGLLTVPDLGVGIQAYGDTAPLSGAVAKWPEAYSLLMHSNSRFRCQALL